MRALLRILAPLLGIAVAAAGILVVIEVVAAWVLPETNRGLWVPRTVSRPLISAFAASRPHHHGPEAAQHDRPLWPSDSPT